jgi:hypothetical protein
VKPQTLFLFLVFLPLWGADEALAASWLPHHEQPTSPSQEVFPLALRDRARTVEQAVSAASQSAASALLAELSPSSGPSLWPQKTQDRPTTPSLIYLLMSLRR